MKAILMTLALVFTISAQAEMCTPPAQEFEQGDYNVTVHGHSARRLWMGLKAKEEVPTTANELDFGFDVKAKYSKKINCWNYVPKQTNEKDEVTGPADCEAFTCTVQP